MNPLSEELKRVKKEIQKHQELLEDPELAPLAREEIEKLTTQKQALEESVTNSSNTTSFQNKTANVQSSPDGKNAIIEIRGAAGGDEAKIWANDLKRMYMRFAENRRFKAQELNESTVKISGKEAFGLFKHESGVHRVQRVPKTEKQGRIHTSTATIAVLPEITASQITISPEDLQWQFTKAGGPGGQNVNKVATAVRLTHKPSGTVISVRQERLQQQNKAIAMDILRSKLWQHEEEKRLSTIKETRRSAVGRGMRAEKIRTYNFPQNRVTDHRIKKSWKNLNEVLDGNLDKVIEAIQNITT